MPHRRPAAQSKPSLEPGAPAPRSLLDVFAETVTRNSARTAIEAPDALLDYGALEQQAKALAARLSAKGVGPGDRVGVYVPSGTAQLYVAILGTLHAGAAYVPVDADDPPARATSIWARAGACAVVEDGLVINELSAPRGEERQLTVEDDAWVIFSSGSTGQPKGIAVSHRSAAAFVDAEAELWTVTAEDRVLAGLSVGFDASCEEMWLAWRHGAALVPAPRALVRTGTELGPWVARRGVSVISTVPTLAAMWNADDVLGVRLLILGGEVCPDALAWRLARDREVWNTYGPTEATVVSTAGRVRAGEAVTIGWPLHGWEVAIVDEHGDPVALGESGELAIGGVGLGRYIDPDMDAARFAELAGLGWARAYRTGDIVRETIDGLHFIGRRDDQIKLAGRRVELGEIDAQLNAVPGVRAASATVQRTASGHDILVGYVVGDADPADVRSTLAERLPEGIVPLVVPLDSLPTSAAGKVDRKALPWPPPSPRGGGRRESRQGATFPPELTGTAVWLAERWRDQLGPLPITPYSNFFELGGNSLSAARLVSAMRGRYPSVTVADVYAHRQLAQLTARLDRLGVAAQKTAVLHKAGSARWGLAQLAGIFALLAINSPQWLLAIFTFDRLTAGKLGPQVGWGWLIAGWLVFGSAFGRAALVLLARRLLLPGLKPGRYPRRGWLMVRIWLLERVGEMLRSEGLSGTPFAARYARLCGHSVGEGARLGTLPPPASLISIGAGATVEGHVDMHGWWIEGDELIVGEVRIGANAYVGARSLLGPGAEIGAGAEIEAGSTVAGSVPAAERWGGSPARHVGPAGESWPATAPPRLRAARAWKAMFIAGLGLQSLIPVLAAVPGILLLAFWHAGQSDGKLATVLITRAPLLAAAFLVSYAVLIALLMRAAGRLVRPGWHPADGAVGWALWLGEGLMADARAGLFPLHSSIYVGPWLRLAGIPVGRRAEVSTAVGLNRLTSLAEASFAADDSGLVGARAHRGWLEVAPIEVGKGTFLGNSAVLTGGCRLGSDCLVGVLTTAPREAPQGTSWLGAPALELPRVPDSVDPERTINPTPRLVAVRGTLELIRILLPATISVVLAGGVFFALESIGRSYGAAAMALAAPFVLLAAGVSATALTVAAKWLIMGRYRPGEHPLWSSFVGRDEIINSLQDQLAGAWLLKLAVATPLLSVYLRAMGAKVGREVWCEGLTITEFDVVELGDGCVVNRYATVQTHLFHDRLMRIGKVTLGPGSSLGPASAALPDSVVGAGTRVGGRSVVLRGEELPPGTSWHGTPVVSV
jgi:non-ribosomal peptide synthetase-like protein